MAEARRKVRIVSDRRQKKDANNNQHQTSSLYPLYYIFRRILCFISYAWNVVGLFRR